MSRQSELAALGRVADTGALSNRNLIINGAMKVAQRGTSTSITTSKSFSPDRFYADENALDEYVGTISQDSDAPDGFSNSLKITTTTQETTLGANEYLYIGYAVEAQDLQHLKYGTSSAQDMTLSFWVKCSVTGTYCVGVYGGDGPRMLNVAYTINAANTWEYKTLKIKGDTGGTMNDDTGEGLRFAWNLSTGTDYQGTDSTSWVDYAVAAWANSQVTNTFITTASSTFFLTGVQLELGDTATEFEHRSYGDELQRCQRYTFIISGAGYTPATSGAYQRFPMHGNGTDSALWYPIFPVPMRADPSLITSNFTSSTVEVYNYSTGNLAGFTSVALAEGGKTQEQVTFTLPSASDVASGHTVTWRWNNSPAAYIGFDAEL